MKNKAIQSFLKMITTATAIIMIDLQVYRLIMFNGFLNIDDYIMVLEEKSQEALLEFASNISKVNDNMNAYIACILNQFKKTLTYFEYKHHYLHHQYLIIFDTKNVKYAPSELTESVRGSIDDFLRVQQKAVSQFILQLEQVISADPVKGGAPMGEEKNMVQPEAFNWLDSTEVCRRLNITSRTLSRHRINKIIPYTLIGGKYFYRLEIVNKILKENTTILE